jgi:hypothetical protein
LGCYLPHGEVVLVGRTGDEMQPGTLDGSGSKPINGAGSDPEQKEA